MSQMFTIKRVNSLPPASSLLPSTMYIVRATSQSLAEVYFTGVTTGSPLEVRKIIGSAEVGDAISTALAQFNNLLIVPDITARNAIATGRNLMVLVLDASADGNIISGSAVYFFNNTTTTWYLVSGRTQIQWGDITGIPAPLTKISEDVDGNFMYNGAYPPVHMDSVGW